VTQPRRITADTTYLLTRRTQRRTHLFRPDEQMNNLYLYLLAVIAERHGVKVHAVTLMSTHEHLVVTDTHGCLPRFLAELHRMVALCVKVYRKWEGEVWDGGKTSVVELRTSQAILEKLAYCAANPVAAGLVRKAADWPGITTLPADLGRSRWESTRPSFYLDPTNEIWPEQATLLLSVPPLQTNADQIRTDVALELCRLEAEAGKEVKAKGWLVQGAHALRAISPFKRAKSWEPLRSLNPSFAVGRGQKQAFFAAAKILKTFRHAYREALDLWRSGSRTVVFPRETWLMRALHSAAICT
jgi:putative transposase